MGAISLICQAVRIACETLEVVETVDKLLLNRNDYPEFRTASIGLRILILGITALEVGAKVRGASSSTCLSIKNGEFIARVLDFPMKIGEAFIDATNAPANASSEGFLKLLNQGFITPLASITRAGMEANAYYEQVYLDMSPEEVAKAQRPIFEYNEQTESWEIVGYKPVNIEECKQFLANAQKAAAIASVVEVVGKTGVVYRAYNLYQRLAQQLSGHVRAAPVALAVAPIQVAVVANQDFIDADILNLTALSYIPEALHEDIVFSKYICSITHQPIRHPVGDPNGRTLYESLQINTWLDNHHSSPVTRLPLSKNQLVPKPGLQILIDQRLKFHEERLKAYISHAFNHISDPDLQTAADIENPHV